MSTNGIVNVGIIGFGEMGKRHALEYHDATQGEMNFIAVVEPEEIRYNQGCEWYGKTPKRYITVKDMLDNENLDGLIISSPNCFHLENLKDCMESNLPIMLEKPLESSFEKICNIVRFSNSYKAPIMVDHVMRYAPIIQKAKELIETGKIGKVCSFNFVQYHGSHSLFTTYRRTLASGGGQLIEKGTHDLDVAFYLCGTAPRRVTGICRQQKYGGDKPNDLTCSNCDDIECTERVIKGTRAGGAVKDVNCSHDLCCYAKEVDCYDNEIALIECENEVWGSYRHCFFVENHYSRRYEIIGTEGLIYIELSMKEKPGFGRLTLSPSRLKQEKQLFEFDYENRIHYNGGPFAGRYFLKMIKGEVAPFTTISEAFAAEMVGIGAMKSSEERRAVNIVEEIVPKDLQLNSKQAYLNKN